MLDRNVKYTKEGLTQREEALGRWESELSELYELQKVKDSEWWKLRTDRLRKKLDAIDSRLDGFQGMDARAIDLHLAERLMLRTELNTADEVSLQIERLEENIAAIRAEIAERKSRLGTATTA